MAPKQKIFIETLLGPYVVEIERPSRLKILLQVEWSHVLSQIGPFVKRQHLTKETLFTFEGQKQWRSLEDLLVYAFERAGTSSSITFGLSLIAGFLIFRFVFDQWIEVLGCAFGLALFTTILYISLHTGYSSILALIFSVVYLPTLIFGAWLALTVIGKGFLSHFIGGLLQGLLIINSTLAAIIVLIVTVVLGFVFMILGEMGGVFIAQNFGGKYFEIASTTLGGNMEEKRAAQLTVLAIGLGGAITSVATPGMFDLFDTAIGITLAVILLTYGMSVLTSVAFGPALGLCIMLIFGFVPYALVDARPVLLLGNLELDIRDLLALGLWCLGVAIWVIGLVIWKIWRFIIYLKQRGWSIPL